MDIPSALDRLVRAARLDILNSRPAWRSRNLRWLPLLVLAALPAGYALAVAALRGGVPGPAGIAGGFVFLAGLIGGSAIRVLGPRLFEEWEHPLDERELMLKARATSISGAVITMLAVLGCFYAASATVFGFWIPVTAVEWVFLGFGIVAYAFTLPVLVASWMQPPPDDEP